MKTKYIAYIAALISVIFVAESKAVLVSDFGTGGAGATGAFTLDGGTTDFPTATQSATGINLIGNDQHIMAGFFASVFDLTGFTGLELVGSISGTNPNTQFIVELFNTDFTEILTYSGAYTDFGSSSSTVALTFVTQTSAFTDIAAFQLTGNGGGAPLNLTLTQFNAIPEPSTYALLGLGMGALYWLRRRRVNA